MRKMPAPSFSLWININLNNFGDKNVIKGLCAKISKYERCRRALSLRNEQFVGFKVNE